MEKDPFADEATPERPTFGCYWFDPSGAHARGLPGSLIRINWTQMNRRFPPVARRLERHSGLIIYDGSGGLTFLSVSAIIGTLAAIIAAHLFAGVLPRVSDSAGP
jgi:hypothetical protein